MAAKCCIHLQYLTFLEAQYLSDTLEQSTILTTIKLWDIQVKCEAIPFFLVS